MELPRGAMNITGRRYNKLVAKYLVGRLRGKLMWLFDCDCGRQTVAVGHSVVGGWTTSCGCHQCQRASEANAVRHPHEYRRTDDGLVTITMKLKDGTVTGTAVLDDIDIALTDYRWYFRDGYAVATPLRSSKKIFMHRMVVAAMGLDIPADKQVDHIDGNRLNNRRCNLRVVTRQENLQHRTVTIARSGYKGVRKQRHRYSARIGHNGVEKHLGFFATAEEAALAYNRAAIEVFGEYAALNCVPGATGDVK